MARILYLEDRKEDAELARQILKSAGHTVTITDSWFAARSELLVNPPDLLITDNELVDSAYVASRKLKGFDLYREVRGELAKNGHADLAQIPIIALTGVPAIFIDQLKTHGVVEGDDQRLNDRNLLVMRKRYGENNPFMLLTNAWLQAVGSNLFYHKPLQEFGSFAELLPLYVKAMLDSPQPPYRIRPINKSALSRFRQS